MTDLKYPHLFVPDSASSQSFTSPRTGRDGVTFPDRPNKRNHAKFVRQALDQIWANSLAVREQRESVSLPTKTGTYIEFESADGFDLKTKSLDRRASGIRLLNVKTQKDHEGKVTKTYATVFIPNGKEQVLLRQINQYENELTRAGNPKHEEFIAGIDKLKEAILSSFWHDRVELIPKTAEWCEVWLRCSKEVSSDELKKDFFELCSSMNLAFKDGYLEFPERIVVLVQASNEELKQLILSFDFIAEFRAAKSTAQLFVDMSSAEQADWVASLADRINVDNSNNICVCILDTGVNNGHLLLANVVSDANCHTINNDWGLVDDDGHGTAMSGVAVFGNNLESALQSEHELTIPYELESVKLIPSSGMYHEKELYGLRTKQAVSRAEISNAELSRVICLAVASEDDRDEGKPSSWSGAVDQMCSGSEDDKQRLIILSAGNIHEPEEWKNYPDSNISQAVHDPGQAWNALTVGAYTEKITLSDQELAAAYMPLAQSGELSPFSSTSHLWDNRWPIKPDIVFEGGNVAIDGMGFVSEFEDLSILTTHHLPTEAQFSVINATSAATAQAARMAAYLLSSYPDAWPETIRALMVHFAEWPETLRAQFWSQGTEKQNYFRLLRSAGYGVPNMNRARESASSSLTLVTEQYIQPFETQKGSSDPKTKDMHLVELPWPAEALSELPDETQVKINVTLSYFVEPGPGEIGWRDKYRYRSHGLDFELIGPTEMQYEFLERLNRAARNGDDYQSSGSQINWAIGSNTRNKGSIHRDWCVLTAKEAASCNVLGVFPRTGWWKERAYLGKIESQARYSLVVTIETESTEIDIYTPVANQIAQQVDIEVPITK